MTRGYLSASFSTVLRKGVKILLGVALIVGALYGFVWITGTFVDMKPGAPPLLSPYQVRMIAITLSCIYSALVLVGKI